MNMKRAALAVALAVGFSSTAWSGTPSTGLGQAWPNTADVSLSPHYHAYLFARDGIRYVQINDLGGTVRAAMATATGTVLVLPIGVDAAHVTTTTPATTGSSATETVYQDATVSVTATPQGNGSLLIVAAQIEQTCDDPGECSNVVSAPHQ